MRRSPTTLPDPPSLPEAVALWRETRQPRLRSVLDRLQARHQPAIPTFRRKDDLHRFYLEVAQDERPELAPWLGANLLHWLPGRDLVGRGEHLLQRIRALRGRFDPRLSHAVIGHQRGTNGEMTLLRVREATRAWLRHRLDVELEHELLTVAGRTGDWALQDVRRWLATIDVPRPTLDASVCDAWLQALDGSRGRDGDDLLRAVFADPDDDAPRAVLADLAVEQGNPWGLFAQLQLREAGGTLPARDRRRADALLKTHGRSWLGPLAEVVRSARFERGFLHTVVLEGRHQVSDARWTELASLSVLGTVTDLDVHGTGGFQLAQMVPNVPNLTRIRADATEVIEALTLARPRRLERIWFRRPLAERLAGVLGLLARVPSMRELQIQADDLPAVLRAGVPVERLLVARDRGLYRVDANGTEVACVTTEPLRSGRLAGLRR